MSVIPTVRTGTAVATRFLLVMLFPFMTTEIVHAEHVPNLINYSGQIADSSGQSVSGQLSIRFAYYPDPSTNTDLWSETQDVTVTDGRFSVLLGSVNPLDENVFSTNQVYLGIKVGSDAEMTPRQRVASVAYALNSARSTSGTSIVAYQMEGSVIGEYADEAISCQVVIPSHTFSPGERVQVQTLTRVMDKRAANLDAVLRIRVGTSGTLSDTEVYSSNVPVPSGYPPLWGNPWPMNTVLVVGVQMPADQEVYISVTADPVHANSDFASDVNSFQCRSLVVSR